MIFIRRSLWWPRWALVAAICAAATFVHAQSDDEMLRRFGKPPSSLDDYKKDISRWAADAGVNCPIVKTISREAEDSRGQVAKLRCVSSDGANEWDLRMIRPPNTFKLLFEPW